MLSQAILQIPSGLPQDSLKKPSRQPDDIGFEIWTETCKFGQESDCLTFVSKKLRNKNYCVHKKIVPKCIVCVELLTLSRTGGVFPYTARGDQFDPHFFNSF